MDQAPVSLDQMPVCPEQAGPLFMASPAPQYPGLTKPVRSAQPAPPHGLWCPPVRPSWADEPSVQPATPSAVRPTAQVPREKHELDKPQSFDLARYIEARFADAPFAKETRHQVEDEWRWLDAESKRRREDKLSRREERERRAHDGAAQRHRPLSPAEVDWALDGLFGAASRSLATSQAPSFPLTSYLSHAASQPQTPPRSQEPSGPQTPPHLQQLSRPWTPSRSHAVFRSQTPPRSQEPSRPQTPPRSQAPSRPLPAYHSNAASHPTTPAWLPYQGVIGAEEHTSIRGQVQRQFICISAARTIIMYLC